jgi:hypothetical protein
VDFFCVVRNDIGLSCNGTLLAACQWFEEADDLLIGKFGLFRRRYSPKLADFVLSLWYGREGAGQQNRTF